MKEYTLQVVDQNKEVDVEIIDGHYGDIVATYYLPNGTLQAGYICDNQWTVNNANSFCQKNW